MKKSSRRKTFAEIVVSELDRRIPFEGKGRRKTITVRERILENLLTLAQTGNTAAVRFATEFLSRPRVDIDDELEVEPSAGEKNIFRVARDKYWRQQIKEGKV